MKTFVQSLLIVLLVLSAVMAADINDVKFQQRPGEMKNLLPQHLWTTDPAEIQKLLFQFLFHDKFTNDKNNLFQSSKLADLRYYTLAQEWNINLSAWENDYQIFNTYDGSSNLTQSLEQDWTDTTWVDYSRATYIYDANENNTEYLLEFWYGVWLPFFKYFYTYDANGWIVEQVVQVGFTGALENYWKYTSTYHAGGYPDETLKYDWESNAWDYDGKMNFSYDANWQMIEWVVLDSANVNSEKSTWAYDANGNQIEEIDQIWNGSAWENENKYTWTYDANNNMLEELEQTWNVSAWENVKKEINIYDANNNNIDILHQVWSNSAWEDENKGILTYDGSNNCTEENWQDWDSWTSVWVNSEKLIHQYIPVGAVDDQDYFIPNEFALSNYPNPFNPQTNIQFYLPVVSEISINIYDLNGEHVKTLVNEQIWNAGAKSVVWNGTDDKNKTVSSGIYIIQFKSEKYNRFKRCLFIK